MFLICICGFLLSTLILIMALRRLPALSESNQHDHKRKKLEKPTNLLCFEYLPTDIDCRVLNGVKPNKRSGHRIFIDTDYLYVMGGYNHETSGIIYKDFFKYNLFTNVWSNMKIEGEFPISLASFTGVQTLPFSKQVVVFGGTAVPFGQASTSGDSYLLTIGEDVVHSTKLETTGTKRPTYGHAMVTDNHGSYYVIGGTTGSEFFLDVDRLHVDKEGKWHWTEMGRHQGDDAVINTGLYRMEAVLDDDIIYLFGGGTPTFVKDFEELITFNLTTKKYDIIRTIPDNSVPVEKDAHPHPLADNRIVGFPKSRRCHSATRWGREVIVVGGSTEDKIVEDADVKYVEIFNDVWSYNLDTRRWKRLPGTLPVHRFFHDAAISEDGRLIVWGGVEDNFSTLRSNEGFSCWIQPPPLTYMSGQTVKTCLTELRATDGLCMSNPITTIQKAMGMEFRKSNAVQSTEEEPTKMDIDITSHSVAQTVN